MKKSALKVVSVSSAKDSYTKTRYNAVRHGVLSNVDVLPWENQADLEHLKQSFLDDFNPQGGLEIYLVEELANLAFRKQRLYKAENALMAQKLDKIGESFNKDTLYNSASLMSPDADIENNYIYSMSFKSILYPDEGEDNDSIADCQERIKTCEALIKKEGLSYEKMLKSLPQELLEDWQGIVRDNSDHPDIETLESLKDYLQDNVIDILDQKKSNLEGKERLRQQAVGMAYIPDDKVQSLQRYEVTMDRLFERKLAALIKLQEIRNNKPMTIQD